MSFSIENRRYIGNKSKLNDWIMQIIRSNTHDVHSFCDIFAGTGTVAATALSLRDNTNAPLYSKVILNDLLYSNHIIYNAFFAQGQFSVSKLQTLAEEWNTVEIKEDNWFSENYGNTYFALEVASRAGYIRQQIEDRRYELTDKEYAILLASLIYSLDRLANTVGHFEAYIKKPTDKNNLQLQLVEAQSFDTVEIFQEDSNRLAREIQADIVYIDPPYNSRQYSRFYHVYETLVKWDKPALYGVARKPAPENMSEYCSSRAYNALQDLINHLHAKYIVVSYNNTYNSRSKSSQNKISLEQIQSILQAKGETQVFTHQYNAFNSGKTDLKDHKEYLFFTTVRNV